MSSRSLPKIWREFRFSCKDAPSPQSCAWHAWRGVPQIALKFESVHQWRAHFSLNLLETGSLEGVWTNTKARMSGHRPYFNLKREVCHIDWSVLLRARPEEDAADGFRQPCSKRLFYLILDVEKIYNLTLGICNLNKKPVRSERLPISSRAYSLDVDLSQSGFERTGRSGPSWRSIKLLISRSLGAASTLSNSSNDHREQRDHGERLPAPALPEQRPLAAGHIQGKYRSSDLSGFNIISFTIKVRTLYFASWAQKMRITSSMETWGSQVFFFPLFQSCIIQLIFMIIPHKCGCVL